MLARDVHWTNPPLKGVLLKEVEYLMLYRPSSIV
jgi:hypothetical protein